MSLVMDATLLDLLKTVFTDIVKIGLPALIASIATYKATRGQVDLERLRIHEKERMDANRKLFMFAQELITKTFPLAEHKECDFLSVMQRRYFGNVDEASLYLSDEALKILELLSSQYVCMTDPDLISEISSEDREKFLEKELFQSAQKLAELARKATRMRRLNA